jgi:hypothetical protein
MPTVHPLYLPLGLYVHLELVTLPMRRAVVILFSFHKIILSTL